MYGSGACKIHNTIKGESWCQDNSYTVIKFSHVIFAWVLQSIWCLIASSCFFYICCCRYFLNFILTFRAALLSSISSIQNYSADKKREADAWDGKKKKTKIKKIFAPQTESKEGKVSEQLYSHLCKSWATQVCLLDPHHTCNSGIWVKSDGRFRPWIMKSFHKRLAAQIWNHRNVRF